MRRLLFAALLVLAFGGTVLAQGRPVASSIPDPFKIIQPEIPVCNGSWGCNTGYTDTNGRTQRNLTINTSIKNLVLIVAGQSNNESEAPSAYSPTNGSAIDNFNIYDGDIYAAQDPELGTSYGTTGSGFMDFSVADKLVSASIFARVILVPIAIGGTYASDWSSGVLAGRICLAMGRLAARGITPATTNVTFAIDWGQGEGDTNIGTSQATYTTELNSIISTAQGCGFAGRFFVNEETWSGGVTSSAVQAAQAAVVNGTTVFAGANLDTLGNTNRVDTTHFNNAGFAAGATLKYNAMVASGSPF